MSNYNASIQNILQQLNTFPISSTTNAEWNMYSINELSFYTSNSTTIPNDNQTNVEEQRQMVIGSLIFTEMDDPTTYTIQNIVSPVGMYVDLIYGFGSYDINGVFTPNISFDGTRNNTITLNVNNIHVYLQRGGATIPLTTQPDVSWSFAPVEIDCNQFVNGHTHSGHYYGIQFIGMLNITNLKIPVLPSACYDIGITCTYTYDHGLIGSFDAFQSGLFVNLTEENQNISITPFSFASSISSGYQAGKFVPVT